MSVPAPLAVCLISCDRELDAEVRAALTDRFTLHTFCVLAEARVWSRANQPYALVADLRKPGHGGHAEERFLDEFEERHPHCELVALVGLNMPEPLERRLATGAFRQVCEPVRGEEVGRHLVENAPPLEAEPEEVASTVVAESNVVLKAGGDSNVTVVSEAPPHAGLPHSPEVDFTLAGLTRSFETNNPRLRMMLADLEVAARHDVTVLLIGETGAGKTFLSRLIHEISPRRNEPFLPVACGALPNDLIESELFGHTRGAFTSAHADKDGKFVAARKGTILLDEIDVLGLEQQVKLLRVIESGEFEPVGSNKTLKCEARLIVASNLDLQPLVEQGRFRPDLYYRLNMLKFDLVPLRTRKEDVVPLARKFVQLLSVKHNIPVTQIDDSLYTALLKYPWPGNVRELEHVIQRAVIYCRDGRLTAAHLPAHVVMCQAGPGNDGRTMTDMGDTTDRTGAPSLGAQVALSEREIIEQTLFKNNNSRTSTAKALGISRVTLYNKMKKYGMMK
jgi:two-component system, NtrC family, response regulator AtoC